MNNRNLNDWAAIAEIVGTIAVVVSLVFVLISVRQNTAVIQATNDNFLYELTDSWYADFATNPELNLAWNKFNKGESLTEAEQHVVHSQIMRQLNVWEVAFTRFSDELMPDNQWEMWHTAMAIWARNDIPRDYWAGVRYEFNSEFAEYVDAIYGSEQR